MQHASLSQPHGAMLRAPLVVGAPREEGGRYCAAFGKGFRVRGLECNGSIAITWAGLACMEPREKSKGLGGMVRLEACVQNVVAEDSPLSVRFRRSKAAREHANLKTLGAMLMTQSVLGQYFAALGEGCRMQCNHGNHLEQPCWCGAPGQIKGPRRNGTV